MGSIETRSRPHVDVSQEVSNSGLQKSYKEHLVARPAGIASIQNQIAELRSWDR